MGTELTTLASRRQFSHGLGVTMKLKVSHVLKEIGFLVFVGEVRCHVDETRMEWVVFDEGRENGDVFKSGELERGNEGKREGE